jgi:hypothetical protein
MKFVATAAIRHKDGLIFSLPRPNRHHNISHALHALGIKQGERGEQGFILSNGEFATREEAKLVAIEANQLLTRAQDGDKLYSECLWYGGIDEPYLTEYHKHDYAHYGNTES